MLIMLVVVYCWSPSLLVVPSEDVNKQFSSKDPDSRKYPRAAKSDEVNGLITSTLFTNKV